MAGETVRKHMVMFSNGVNVGIKASFHVKESGFFKFYKGWKVVSVSAANPAVVTTDVAHDIATGEVVRLKGVNSCLSGVMAEHVATDTGTNTFTIPFNNTDAGFGGWVGRELEHEVKDTNVDAVVISKWTAFAENEDDVI